MNGIHDLGGMHGFGPIEREEGEPLFHHDWERRVFGLFAPISVSAKASVDEFRSAIENMGAANYLATSYYEHWLHGFETLVVDRALVSADELAAGRAATPTSAEPPLKPEGVARIVASGHSNRAEPDAAPRFRAGDLVRARNLHPRTHTRLPRYVRGKLGRIDRHRGGFLLPDAIATREGDRPQHCYSVRFEAEELWGADAPGADAVYIDLFDEYLEAASA